MKCFILILGVLVSARANAQFQPTIQSQMNRDVGTAVRTQIRGQTSDDLYKMENDKVVDSRNQFVNARKLQSLVAQKEQPKLLNWGASSEKARYEINQKIKYTCRQPWKLQKHGEGSIEAIRGIGAKQFVKVQGCDYLVDSSLISFVEQKLPQKQQVRSKPIAQQTAR